jgi:large subunit ribosomal protein L18
MKTKSEQRARIRRRIRAKVAGTAERPRLSVFRSNKFIYAQVIDDQAGRTLAAASSRESDITGAARVERSKAVGQRLAERAKAAGVESVVFDRGGYRYHGNVRALAEGARDGGLQF